MWYQEQGEVSWWGCGARACPWVRSISARVLSAACPGAHWSLPAVIYLGLGWAELQTSVLMSQGLLVFLNSPCDEISCSPLGQGSALKKKCRYVLLFHTSPWFSQQRECEVWDASRRLICSPQVHKRMRNLGAGLGLVGFVLV